MAEIDESAWKRLVVMLIVKRGGEASREQLVSDLASWQEANGPITAKTVDNWFDANRHLLDDIYADSHKNASEKISS